MYKYGHDDIDVYVEEGTDRVPADGRFYIVRAGVIVEDFPTAKKALARLGQLRFAIQSGDGTTPDADARSRMLQAGIVGRFLGESTREHNDRRTKKGGKGR